MYVQKKADEKNAERSGPDGKFLFECGSGDGERAAVDVRDEERKEEEREDGPESGGEFGGW